MSGDPTTRYVAVSRWVVDRFEGVGTGFRQDLLATVQELAATKSRPRRTAELLSLVALGWRLRSRARTAGVRRAQWSQGVYLGGILLGLVLAAHGWATAAGVAVADRALPVGAAVGNTAVASAATAGVAESTWAVVLTWAAAVASTGVVALGLAGCRLGTVCWAALTVLTDRVARPDSEAGVALVAGYLLVVVAVAAGNPGPVRRCWVAAGCVACTPAASVALVLGAGTDAADLTLHVALSIVGPGLLLAAGRFDPRLAVAGTVIWFWRLSASAVAELATSLSVLSGTGESDLLLRWLAMSAGVAFAVGLSRISIQRLFEP